MKKIFNKKRGELTTQQIVGLIILITSFAVILFFFFRLNLGETTDKEICHNSVVLKGKGTLAKLAAGGGSLDCRTNYVCISGGGKCEGINPTETKKINLIDSEKPEDIKKNKEAIMEVIADEMADCWWMFGEGKIDYIETGLTKGNYCSICSQILFDDSLKEINVGSEIEIKNIKEGIISKDKLYDYLAIKKMPRKDINYAEYFFGTNDIEKIKKRSVEEKKASTFGYIKVGEQYFVVMGIINEVSILSWAGAGAAAGSIAAGGLAVVGTVFFVSNPVGWVSGALIIGLSAGVAGTVGSEISGFFGPEIGAITVKGKGIENQFMAPTIVEAKSDKFNYLSCDDVITYN